MTRTTILILFFAVQLIVAVVSHQYLTHRVDGKLEIRNFCKFRFDFYSLLVILTAYFASVFVFALGFLWDGESLMRALMNAEVMLWLSVIGYIDAREKIIPNGCIVVGLCFWLVLYLVDVFVGNIPWMKLLVFSGLGGFGCGGLLFIIAIIVKSALGMGDVKMFFVLGLLYGLMDAYGILLFSVIAMGIVSIVLLLAKKVTTKSTIPMAPFVILGFFFSILAGM